MDSSVTLVIHDSDPFGVVTVDVSNWSAEVISLPIAELSRLKSQVRHIGVYVLVGARREDPTSSVIYIGEAEDIPARLSRSHDQLKDDSILWEKVIALTSIEMNKARARWVESRLISLARAANRVPITNGKGSNRAPVNQSDEIFAGHFLEKTLMILPFLGVSAFHSPREAGDPAGGAQRAASTLPGVQRSEEPDLGRKVYMPDRYIAVLRAADGPLTAREIAERVYDRYPTTMEEKRQKSRDEAIRSGSREAMVEQMTSEVAARARSTADMIAVPGTKPIQWTLAPVPQT